MSNNLLDHFRAMPRQQLQKELRRITGIENLYLWEFIGYSWMYVKVHAGPEVSAKTGVQIGDVVGYNVVAGHVMGGALGDLIGVTPMDDPPAPDPFR